MSINLNNLMSAIRSQESGGNYSIVNRTSSALGAYQIMPFNLPSWGAAAGYPGITPAQFLANPAAQDAIAGTQLQAYANQYNDVGAVAQAWYGGPRSVGQNLSGGAGYPTTNQYATQVVGRYNALGGDNGPSGTPYGVVNNPNVPQGYGNFYDMGDDGSDGSGNSVSITNPANPTNLNYGDITGYSVAGVNAPMSPGVSGSGDTTDLSGIAGTPDFSNLPDDTFDQGPVASLGNDQGTPNLGGGLTSSPLGSSGQSGMPLPGQQNTGEASVAGQDVQQGLGTAGADVKTGAQNAATGIAGTVASAINSIEQYTSSAFVVAALVVLGLILVAYGLGLFKARELMPA